jgi:flavin-dependent dehydrogenase
MFDVAIIGASVGGSTAAHTLAAFGHSVALIDAQCFPRTKSCGEGLSEVALQVLVEMGLAKDAELYPLQGFHVVRGGTERILKKKGQVVYGVSRDKLDGALVEEVCKSSKVEPIFGKAVRQVVRRGDRHEIHLQEGRTLEAKSILVASGIRGFLFPKHRKVSPDRRIGFTTRWHGGEHCLPSEVQIHLKEEGEFFVTPTSPTRFNFSMLARKGSCTADTIAQQAAQFARERGLSPDGFDKVCGCSTLGVGKGEDDSDHTVWRIGDAIESFDPVGGMGMTHAILSGRAAAQSMHGALTGLESFESARARYSNEREVIALPLRRFTAALFAGLVKYPYAVRLPRWLLQSAHKILHSVTIQSLENAHE